MYIQVQYQLESRWTPRWKKTEHVGDTITVSRRLAFVFVENCSVFLSTVMRK